MRVPTRKPGKYANDKTDPHMTEEKFCELKNKLEGLKKILPQASKEMRRLAEMGDFSENAAYQMAKARLRGINDSIFKLNEQLKHAVIIKPNTSAATLQIGHKVTVEIEGKQNTYLVLGSTEADPLKGIISHNSPLGLVLLDHKAGDTVILKRENKEIKCRIIKIE